MSVLPIRFAFETEPALRLADHLDEVVEWWVMLTKRPFILSHTSAIPAYHRFPKLATMGEHSICIWDTLGRDLVCVSHACGVRNEDL